MEREERASGNTHSNYLIDNRMEKKYIALFWWRAKPPILLLINFFFFLMCIGSPQGTTVLPMLCFLPAQDEGSGGRSAGGLVSRGDVVDWENSFLCHAVIVTDEICDIRGSAPASRDFGRQWTQLCTSSQQRHVPNCPLVVERRNCLRRWASQ